MHVNVNIIASAQYNAHSLAFILAPLCFKRESDLQCDLWIFTLPFSAAKANVCMHLTLELKLTMEPAYRNGYSSSFAQPLPEAQRIEAMNAKVYCTMPINWRCML